MKKAKKIKTTVKPSSTLSNKTGNWRTFIPKIDLDKCISCGMCSKVCPEGAITMVKNNKYKSLKPKVDYDFCKGCGICATECPVKAIKMELENK